MSKRNLYDTPYDALLFVHLERFLIPVLATGSQWLSFGSTESSWWTFSRAPTLLSTTTNVQTSNTAIQIVWTTIISHLKISNGKISDRYTGFLKNGIFFNIVRPAGDICTLESEYRNLQDKNEHMYGSSHKQRSWTRQLSLKKRVDNYRDHLEMIICLDSLWFFFVYAVSSCQQKKKGHFESPLAWDGWFWVVVM